MKQAFYYQVLRWLFLGLTLILFLLCLRELVSSLGKTLNLLSSAGWTNYLEVKEGIPVLLLRACLGDQPCQQAFQDIYLKSYSLYLPVLMLLTLGASVVFSLLADKPLKNKSPGGAQWSIKKDLKLYLKGEKGNPQRGYLGLTSTGNILRVPERFRCAHTLIIGATGARKSTGYHKPNLVMDAQDGVSAIVIDLKYPDITSGFFDMVPLFAKAGHDIQLFLPYGEDTFRLPLLHYADTLQGASELADMIVPAAKNEGAEFYRKQERLLLTGLLMGFASMSTPSLGGIFRLLSQGRTAIQTYFHKHPDESLRARVKGLFDLDARTFAGIISGLAGELQAFDDPRLEQATTESENPKENIDLEAIGLRPTLLYIGLPQEHLQGTRAHVLLKLIKRAIDLALLKTANAHGGKLPNHTSFYLDEFANLGVLPNVSENFATMRSRRVAYHVSLQNRAQGEALYGRDQFRSFFTNNFQQVMLFPRSLKFEDAEYFSKALGMKAVLDKAKGSSREGFFDKRRRSELIREVAEPLLSIEAMMTWPEEKAILLASGIPPTQVLLPRLDEAKILGLRNPLHRFYQATQLNLKPQLLAEILLNKCNDSYQKTTQEPKEELASNRLELDLSPQVKSPVEDTDAKALQDWVDKILEQPIKTKLHINPRTQKLSKISLLDISIKPENLGHWIQKGWIKLTNDEIGLVGEGLKKLDEKRLQELKRLEQERPSRPKPAKSPSKVALSIEDAQKLRQYIQSNSQHLKGHPAYESLDETDHPDVVGLYQPVTLLLDKDYLETLLRFDLPEALPIRKEGSQGKQRWIVELTLSDLKHFPKLAKWYETNAHLLKDHPRFNPAQTQVSNAGVFLPESISLSKQTFKELLGKVPSQAKSSRPTLNGKRPYLMTLKLPMEEEKSKVETPKRA